LETLRARVAGLPRTKLPLAEAMDLQLLESCLTVLAWEQDTPHFHLNNPAAVTGETIFGVMSLFLRRFAPLPVRTAAAVERLRAIPGFLAQARAAARGAPRVWVERAVRECFGAELFLTRGIDLLIDEEGAPSTELRPAARTAALAFESFRAFLQGDVLPQAPAAGYACGAEALELLLHRGHAVTLTLDELVELATERLVQGERNLDAQARRLGATTWQEALEIIAHYHPRPEQYYARYTELWHTARAVAEAARLVTWPEFPIRYVPQPRWARDAAPFLYFLAYRAPAPYDPPDVVDYWVVPVDATVSPDEQQRRLRAHNDAVILLNHVIHHGGLGHHVQNWYAYRVARSRLARVAAVDCASRIALFCGGTMAEGWACYAVDLMDEIGFLDERARFVAAHTRVRLAARALVDVRLHTGQWTLEHAATFYETRVGLSPNAARAEAVKNSMFPGTAMAYLLGVEQLHALRQRLRFRPGFDLRAFHDRLLSFGSVPVGLAAAALEGAREYGTGPPS
jgi:hypothetical protein